MLGQLVEEWKEGSIEGDSTENTGNFGQSLLPTHTSKHLPAVFVSGAFSFQVSHLANLSVCALFLKCVQTIGKVWAYVCVGLGCVVADGIMVPTFLQKSAEGFRIFMQINRKANSECFVRFIH